MFYHVGLVAAEQCCSRVYLHISPAIEHRSSHLLCPSPPPPGPKYLSDEEVPQVGDLNWRQSHATHDLYHAIEAKDYPEWELAMQVGLMGV